MPRDKAHRSPSARRDVVRNGTDLPPDTSHRIDGVERLVCRKVRGCSRSRIRIGRGVGRPGDALLALTLELEELSSLT